MPEIKTTGTFAQMLAAIILRQVRQATTIIISIPFWLASCSKTDKQIDSESADKDTVQDTTTRISTGSQVESIDVVNTNDAIVYDSTVFPEGDDFETRILTTGVFHQNEVDGNSDQQNWFGLYSGELNCYLKRTIIKMAKVNDPVLDEDDEKTGWEITTNNDDDCVLLIESLPTLTERLVQKIQLPNHIYPSDTMSFNYSGIDYKIYATGGKRKVQNNPEWFEVWNYKLFLTAKIDGGTRKSLLVAHQNFDDNMTTILFAGDIDGDGILDLIIDTSRHYNAISPTIYLSKSANKGEILKPVGKHTSVGC